MEEQLEYMKKIDMINNFMDHIHENPNLINESRAIEIVDNSEISLSGEKQEINTNDNKQNEQILYRIFTITKNRWRKLYQ